MGTDMIQLMGISNKIIQGTLSSTIRMEVGINNRCCSKFKNLGQGRARWVGTSKVKGNSEGCLLILRMHMEVGIPIPLLRIITSTILNQFCKPRAKYSSNLTMGEVLFRCLSQTHIRISITKIPQILTIQIHKELYYLVSKPNSRYTEVMDTTDMWNLTSRRTRLLLQYIHIRCKLNTISSLQGEEQVLNSID